MREIIVDNFAGGGGASTGIELAIGRSVDIAINHDENAIAMHKTNHPDTLHYCESVFDVDPVAATGGKPVGLAWFSPDCRHFSKAKGAKPVKKEIRGLAWIVLRWALAKRPRVMMLENVEEFKTWGPLLADEMRPDPARTGETFNAFVGMLSTGIPADHPALSEVCEFLSIERGSEQAQQLVDGLGYDVDYRELRACDYGAPTIRKRFFMVMRCDGCPIQWPAVTHGDPKSLEVQSGRLMPWRTAAECIDWNVPALSIFDRKKPLAENTLKRIARGIQRFVIESASPFIVKCNHTSTKTSYDCFRGQALGEPLQAITKTHGYALAVPHLTKFRTGAIGQPVTEPVPTVTAGTSKRPGGNGHALGIVEAAIAPFVGRQFGASVGHRADEPSATITAGGGGKSQLVGAFLAKHYGGNYTGPGVNMDEPAHSVTTVDHHAVVASHLVKLRGTCRDGQRLDVPMPTITAGGQHVGEVRTFLETYCGESDDEWLVTIDGVKYQIVDIGMRMLQPHELYKAQGFPDGYVIDQDYRGNRYAKDKQVARCGNAVPPPFARALVEANLPELCAVQQQEVA
ncbi:MULTISPECIES: DNA cytosine methyltransferase [Citrobacter]|uniref:DNA (cytosine-5-)-methyltransferase n=1 Tax=Citrobacter youngae TaxID=133448 RepID=A0A9Q7ZRZ8_9ENTR|nr:MULTISPECIES: DNA cytosine methyltransferase [Citrobacter]MDM2807966.1 DNA cytosine methyltransferase [Citrobacter sp. Cpo107]SUX80773.1 prophage DNA cytosine methylase [Citrobacter youngae]